MNPSLRARVIAVLEAMIKELEFEGYGIQTEERALLTELRAEEANQSEIPTGLEEQRCGTCGDWEDGVGPGECETRCTYWDDWNIDATQGPYRCWRLQRDK